VCATLQVGFEGREAIPEGWEKWLLDMAGLATIADMVPLTGENRVIAKYGLLVMRKSPRLGLQQLCKQARVNQRMITEDDVGFMIGPRVNAASRMGDPRDAFDLFTATDVVQADVLAKKLEALNRTRRASAGAITKAVHARLDARRAGTDGTLPEVIAMGDPDWRPGLLGLVANSIAEEFSRPVFLWGREGSGLLKGSCRAGRKDAHILDIMQATEDTFHGFGGHAASGGFSVREDRVSVLEENLVKGFLSLPDKARESLDEKADVVVHVYETDKSLLRKLDKLAPFGMGNPKPTIALRNVRVVEVSWFGKNEEHLRIRVQEDELSFGSDSIEAISFFARGALGAAWNKLEQGSVVSLLANIEIDTFGKRQPVRLRLLSVS
jgi:single-stranded-DNA-specific exonuclease